VGNKDLRTFAAWPDPVIGLATKEHVFWAWLATARLGRWVWLKLRFNRIAGLDRGTKYTSTQCLVGASRLAWKCSSAVSSAMTSTLRPSFEIEEGVERLGYRNEREKACKPGLVTAESVAMVPLLGPSLFSFPRGSTG
jgi:hypothetical protein